MVFWDRVSLCNSPNCPGTHSVSQVGLELIEILLPLPPSAGIKGMCHYCPAIFKNFKDSKKKKRSQILMLVTDWATLPSLVYHSWLKQKDKKKSPCISMSIIILIAIASAWNPSSCPSSGEWIQKLWHTHMGKLYSVTKEKVEPTISRKMDELGSPCYLK